MRARLICRWGRHRGLEFVFHEGATIGRSRDTDLRLESSAVSSHHARIVFDEQRDSYILEDLDSLNGTLLDGTRVRWPERLTQLHILEIAGEIELLFQRLDSGEGVESQAQEAAPEGTMVDAEMPPVPAALQSERPASDVDAEAGDDAGESEPAVDRTTLDAEIPLLPDSLREAGESTGVEAEDETAEKARDEGEVPIFFNVTHAGDGPSYHLEVDLPDGGTRSFALQSGENVVGRTQEAEITILASEISRRHAVLRVSAGRVFVRDEGSSNKTFIDEREVSAEEEVGPGAPLRFGGIEARLRRGGNDRG